MEQLEKKVRELKVVARMCNINPEELLEDIAISIEKANKSAKQLNPQDETKDPYLQWWGYFLREWNGKCFRRCLTNAEIHSLKTIREWSLWFGRFEALCMIGCDMTRITRLNDLKEAIAKVIAHHSPSETELKAIWRWHNESTNQLDEAVLKMIDLSKERQRRAFAQTLRELREYDEASLLGELKRLMSE